MIYKNIFNLLGRYLFYFAFLFLAPLTVALFYEHFSGPYTGPASALAFVKSLLICLLLSAILCWLSRGSKSGFHRKESILVVVLIWVLSPAVSSLPFLLSRTLENPVQAYFECVSGFTTTGSSIISKKNYNSSGQELKTSLTIPGRIPTTYSFKGNIEPWRSPDGKVLAEGVEAISRGILFWRSFIQWIGGLGIVVLVILVLPTLGIGGKRLASSETSNATDTALTPRVVETAVALWKIYLFFTLAQILLLKATNGEMPWFDAVTITFSTLSTGGFSVRNASVGFYENPTTEWIVILFMIIGSISFSLWFYVFKGKIYKALQKELFLFLGIIAVFCLVGTYFLTGMPQQALSGTHLEPFSLGEAFRAISFQFASAISSSGFSTSNFDIWPYPVQAMLILLMCLGGMVGSTAGGIKILRSYILFKTAQFKVESFFRPETVRVLSTNNRSISAENSSKALTFFLIYTALAALATTLLIFDGVDLETAFGLVICNINNSGFSFAAFGPMESCAFLSNFGLLLCAFLMIAGRLEIFVLFTILTPAFWRKNT